jgi:hypothetical protein
MISTARAMGGLAMTVLQVGAMLDEPFDLLAVIRCAELPLREVADELDRLWDLGILDVDGEGYRFRHPVAREVLADTVSPARRHLVRSRRQRSTDVPGARWPAATASDEGADPVLAPLRLAGGTGPVSHVDQ